MKKSEYWENYYKQHSTPTIPSQFGAFASSEMPQGAIVIEIGCGNGRDSLFFAKYGFRTIGVDRSQEAIAFCNGLAKQNSLAARFICSDVKDIGNTIDFSEYITGSPVSIYSRFFLHSITDEEECVFLKFVKNTLDKYGGKLFLEFRTDRDRELHKVTRQHFRRFIKPFDFINRVTQAGLNITYFTEGFGFAKYIDEDAHVARIVLTA